MPLKRVSRSGSSKPQQPIPAERRSTNRSVRKGLHRPVRQSWNQLLNWRLGRWLTLLTLALVLGFSGLLKLPNWLHPGSSSTNSARLESSVLAFADRSPSERADLLAELAQGPASLDRNRARYLLATDLIQQDHGGQALPLLDGLEQDYQILGAEILAKRAQAQTATSNPTDATKTWKTLLKKYPNDPTSAEALYRLGQTDAKYWDQALEKFPAHPRSRDIALARLEKNPKQPQLLLLLARHAVYSDNIVALLNRLKKEYMAQLSPADWEAIGFAYWENAYYGSAGDAYARATPSALNLYRAARGAQLGSRSDEAEQRYRALVQAFPTEKESSLALLRLADLADQPQTAISHLDQVVDRFPDQAPAALLAKSKIFQKQNSDKTALQLRQSVLEKYSHSDTAAQIRWEQAELLDQQGDTNGAWAWAKQVVEQNPDSEFAARAAFWIGKWAAELKQPQQSQDAYQFTLNHYPDSYYAWRAATLLGWQVGDFSTLRQRLPQVTKAERRLYLPAGSEAVKELYRLGQDRDAWGLWQVEFTNRLKPTVAEQFTDGLLRLGVNDTLDGIFMLSSLNQRQVPAEKAEYKTLKQQFGYWQALYPLLYQETIEPWARQRQLNPMLVIALIRQESRFEPKIESAAGAVGLMQVMPDTAKWVASQVGLKDYSLSKPLDNINLGTWYLDYVHHQYGDNSMLAVASYNAGPGSVSDWIKKYGTNDLDRFVEQIPFPETRDYVESVLGNYWNYLRLYNTETSQKLAAVSPEQAALAKSAM
jgi:soluble lytic murein transglycosylase